MPTDTPQAQQPQEDERAAPASTRGPPAGRGRTRPAGAAARNHLEGLLRASPRGVRRQLFMAFELLEGCHHHQGGDADMGGDDRVARPSMLGRGHWMTVVEVGQHGFSLVARPDLR